MLIEGKAVRGRIAMQDGCRDGWQHAPSAAAMPCVVTEGLLRWRKAYHGERLCQREAMASRDNTQRQLEDETRSKKAVRTEGCRSGVLWEFTRLFLRSPARAAYQAVHVVPSVPRGANRG
jgi:hypothetical protein